MNPSTPQHPISLLICALGGEGGGVLTEWLIDVARHAGYAAQSTSIPGVAQRTGATTYYLEVFPVPLAALNGKRPVFSLNPVPGALDGLVSSELLETARQGSLGLPSPARTVVITSSARTLTTLERMAMGDGRTEPEDLLAVVRAVSREHHVLDMADLARRAGTIVSAVMLGTIAASGLLPFPRSAYEAVIQQSGGSAAASLRGFVAGWEAVATPREQAAMVADMARELLSNKEQPIQSNHAVGTDFLQEFPAALRERIALGHARMLDYQGPAYAALYLERLQRVLAAESGSAGKNTSEISGDITHEMARWLALWMAFDDIVRVADLKSRGSRWLRVKGEVKAKDHDLLQVYDHFKPGVPEFAALLPQRWAQKLVAWDRRRQASGKTPWAMPLKVGTHSVRGMLALRGLASLKALRPYSSRYHQEQALITTWLDSVVTGTLAHPQLGHELALCGRLIKGYGSTNERGKDNLLHIVNHLATSAMPAIERAQAIAAARTAALADDAGQALDRTLVQHGAPARAVKEQPIRWMRRPSVSK